MDHLYQNLHPVFPGKIGCGMKLTRSRRTTEDVYRTRGAASRKGLRAAYRREFSRVEVLGIGAGKEHEGKRIRLWKPGAPSFKVWLREPERLVA